MLKTIELKASIENYTQLTDWWHDIAASWNLSDKLINKIDVCMEEIYVNIASYAYGSEEGTAKISACKNNNEIVLQFEDRGVKYDPLQKEDPDITLSVNERPIGGLGIFMVKEMASSVEYKREDDKNILILKFSID